MESIFVSIVIKIKKNLIAILMILFIIMLILYSKSNIEAAKDGVNIWINHVFPCLFPFFVATEILCNTNVLNILGKYLEKITSKLFRVSGEGAFILIMGIICGYPTGAKIVADLRKQKVLTLEEAERLIAFTNNSGPLFILGTVGVSLLNSQHLGYILLISHIISCLVVGFVFRNWKKGILYSQNKMVEKENKNVDIKNFGEILGNSVRNSIKNIVHIGGFIVLFSVIISMLNTSGAFKLIPNQIRKIRFGWND